MMLPTYVISLPESADRRETCFKACREAGLEPQLFEAVNGRELIKEYESAPEKFSGCIELSDKTVLSLGFGRHVTIADKLIGSELGCALSHLKLYEKIAADKSPYSLILEDDTLFTHAVKEVLPLILEKKDHWDIVQLAHRSGVRGFFVQQTITLDIRRKWFLKREGMGWFDPIFNRRRIALLCAGYIINRKAATRLVKLGFPVRMPADYLMGLCSYHKLRLFTLHPMDCFIRLGNFASTIDSSLNTRPRHRLS